MGWIGLALIMLGNIGLSGRHHNAFILILMGNFCWLANGFVTGRPDIITLAVMGIIIHTRNYYIWKKHK